MYHVWVVETTRYEFKRDCRRRSIGEEREWLRPEFRVLGLARTTISRTMRFTSLTSFDSLLAPFNGTFRKRFTAERLGKITTFLTDNNY